MAKKTIRIITSDELPPPPNLKEMEKLGDRKKKVSKKKKQEGFMAKMLKAKVLLASTEEELARLEVFLSSVDIEYLVQIAEHKVLIIYRV